MGDKFETLGRDLTLRVTAPIVGIGAAITKVSADFETSLSKIVGLVGVSREQVNDWKEDILALSRETAKAPGELAEAMFFVTSAGLKGKEALDVLGMSARAAAAGLGETKVVADLVTSAMNAYGIENLSASKATDILVATVREGKAEAPELAAAMGQVLPVSSAMGISFDQVGAAIAGMTRTGTNAATASTQLRQIMVSILKPSSQARDTLESLGLSAGGLRSQIKEQGLLATLQTLVDSFGDNEEASAQVFGNVRALAGVMDLLGGNAESNVAIFDSLKDSSGALDHAFEAVSETAGFKMQQAVVTLKTIMIDLGDTLLPMVASAAEKASVVLDKLGIVLKIIPGPVKQLVIVLAGLLATLGPILFIAGAMMKTIGSLGTVFGMLASKGIPIAIMAVKALGTAMSFLAANPIVLIIGAIILVTFLIIKNWSLITEKTRWLVEKVSGFFKFLWEGISMAVEAFVRYVKLRFDEFKEVFLAVGEFVADVIKVIAKPFVWLYKNICEPITLLIQAIVYRVFYEIFIFLEDILKSIVSFFDKAWNFIYDLTVGVWNKIKDFFISIFNFIYDNVISPRIEAIKNLINNVWNSISNLTRTLWNRIKDYIVSPLNTAKNSIFSVINSIAGFIGGVWNNIKSFLWNMAGNIKDAIVAPFKWAFDAIERWADKIKETANKINPFYRQSPSLVDNVRRGIEVIQKEYGKLADIRMPIANSLFGFENGNEAFGGARPLKQEINVNIEKVSDDMDVEAIGRELGFKASLVPEG